MSDDMVRAVPDWLDSWMEFTARMRSPEHYRLWTGYSIIAGVMERKIWLNVSGFWCFPNLYILLIAKPGIGKSVAIKEATQMWIDCRKVNIGPSGMTKAALIDHINDECGREVFYNGHKLYYYPLSLAADEFGILLPEHNLELLNIFNTLYDCSDGFSDRTRKDGLKTIEKPALNLIAGTQPDYLNEILPPTAFGMGFTSRIIMVHSDEMKKRKMFEKAVKPEAIRVKLVHDLQIIQKCVGEMFLTEDAEEFMEDWFQNKSDLDAPDHPQLTSYRPRRNVSLMKMAMIRSMSRNNDLIIELEDVEFVLEMLKAAEKRMPEVFTDMTSSVDTRTLLEIHRYCFKFCLQKEVDVISETDLMYYISSKVDVHRAKYFLMALIDGGRIKLKGANNAGYRKFIPVESKEV